MYIINNNLELFLDLSLLLWNPHIFHPLNYFLIVVRIALKFETKVSSIDASSFLSTPMFSNNSKITYKKQWISCYFLLFILTFTDRKILCLDNLTFLQTLACFLNNMLPYNSNVLLNSKITNIITKMIWELTTYLWIKQIKQKEELACAINKPWIFNVC